jgi:hypothetical protein
LAQLLDNGREASARIRVENVIATDIAVEVMEIVELYCELLLARAAVLDQSAFAEKGVRARNKARDIMANKGANPTNAASRGRRVLGFGFSKPLKTAGTDDGGGHRARSKIDAARKRDDDDYNENINGEDKEGGEEEEVVEEENCFFDQVLDEAAAAIFYSWPRFPREVRELTTLRSLLIDRYGKDFATLAQESDRRGSDKTAAAAVGIKIPERLIKRLRVRPPSKELIESYLREIAKAYGVEWPKEIAVDGTFVPDEPENPPPSPPSTAHFYHHDSDNDGGPPSQPSNVLLSAAAAAAAAEAATTVDPNKSTPPSPPQDMTIVLKSPVSIAPPGPRSDNPSPRLKIPSDDEHNVPSVPAGKTDDYNNNDIANSNSSSRRTAPATTTATTITTASATGGKRVIPEVDELARRFAALRR